MATRAPMTRLLRERAKRVAGGSTDGEHTAGAVSATILATATGQAGLWLRYGSGPNKKSNAASTFMPAALLLRVEVNRAA
jgi:hypothetical protein